MTHGVSFFQSEQQHKYSPEFIQMQMDFPYYNWSVPSNAISRILNIIKTINNGELRTNGITSSKVTYITPSMTIRRESREQGNMIFCNCPVFDEVRKIVDSMGLKTESVPEISPRHYKIVGVTPEEHFILATKIGILEHSVGCNTQKPNFSFKNKLIPDLRITWVSSPTRSCSTNMLLSYLEWNYIFDICDKEIEGVEF